MFIASIERNTINRDSTPDGIIMPSSPSPENTLPNAKPTHFEQRHTFLMKLFQNFFYLPFIYQDK